MEHQRHRIQSERVYRRLEIARMIEEPVLALRLIGEPHANQVDRDTAGYRRHMRDHVSPQIRPGRIPVDEHHGIAPTLVQIVIPNAIQHEHVARERIEALPVRHAPSVTRCFGSRSVPH
jgi:hypothetical protein